VRQNKTQLRLSFNFSFPATLSLSSAQNLNLLLKYVWLIRSLAIRRRIIRRVDYKTQLKSIENLKRDIRTKQRERFSNKHIERDFSTKAMHVFYDLVCFFIFISFSLNSARTRGAGLNLISLV